METKKFTVQELMQMETFGRIHLSADGSMVVYEQKRSDMEADEGKTDLWWVSTEMASVPKRLTSSGKDSSPSWSFDGSRVAFISSRSGKGQLYVLARSGGEAVCIETEYAPTGILKWSPDDTHIAFLASVERRIETARYAGEPDTIWQEAAQVVTDRAAKAKAAGKPKAEEGKTAPVRVITDFEYRRDGVGFIYERRQQLFVLCLADGSCVQCSHTEDMLRDFAWLNNETLIYNTDISVLEGNFLETTFTRVKRCGESLPLTGRTGIVGSASQLVAHPSGKGIFYCTSRELGGMKPSELVYWDIDSAEHLALTSDVDHGISNVQVNSLGNKLYFMVSAHAQNSIWEATWEDSTCTVVTKHTYESGNIEAYSLADNGFAFVRSGPREIPQLYFHQDIGEWRLTEINASLLSAECFQPVEVLHYPSFDGCEVEGFLMKPLGYQEGTLYPTILSVHGGPTSAFMRNFNGQLQFLATEGYAVLFVNPRGSTTYGEQFTRGVFEDWGGKDYQDIMAGADKVVEMGIADPNRLGIMGWSYGGYMTCWSITQTTRFRAAIGGANISSIYNLSGNSDIGSAYDEALMGGTFFDLEELYMQRSAIRHVRKVETPILLLHGEADVRCPVDQSEMYYTALKRLGKEAVFVRYPGQFHGLVKPSYVQDRWLRTIGWFDHYLKG